MIVKEILDFLRRNASDDDMAQWQRSIKTHNRAYGVKLTKINPHIAAWAKRVDINDLHALWKDSMVESRLIAAKLLGRLGKKHPEEAIKLIEEFSQTLKDWPTTDTLATQSVRPLLKIAALKKRILYLARASLLASDRWRRRFGVVLFINFTESVEARRVAQRFLNDEDYYVRKAAEWLRRKTDVS